MILIDTVVVDPTPDPGPEPLPPVYVEPRLRLGVMLVGGDGSTWDLYDGPVRLLGGATGFGTPNPGQRFRDSAIIDGSSRQGMRAAAKQVTLPVYIHEPTSMGWRDTDAAFFAAIAPDAECRLIVTTPDAAARSIGLWFDDGGDVEYDVDPLLLRYGAYQLRLTAPDPYWHGTPVGVRYEVVEPKPLFPGPPFNINPTNTLAEAKVTNPGDVPAAPRWTVRGPFTGFTVGTGDSVTSWSKPAGVPAGDGVVVDMDPRRLSVTYLSGGDAWDQVTVADFKPIPAGTEVPLSLDLVGAAAGTSVELAFTPRYRRAW